MTLEEYEREEAERAARAAAENAAQVGPILWRGRGQPPRHEIVAAAWDADRLQQEKEKEG